MVLKAIADAHRHLSLQDFKLGHQANAKHHLDEARGMDFLFEHGLVVNEFLVALEKAVAALSRNNKNTEQYYSVWKYLGDINSQYFHFQQDKGIVAIDKRVIVQKPTPL